MIGPGFPKSEAILDRAARLALLALYFNDRRRRRPVDTEILAKACGVCRRSIQRDLRAVGEVLLTLEEFRSHLPRRRRSRRPAPQPEPGAASTS